MGRGGGGEVYLAIDLNVPGGKHVAIKRFVPPPNLSSDELQALQQQFREEAGTLARLHHPSLPQVTDYFAEAGFECLVMVYIAGENLDKVLQQHGGPLPENRVLSWADQILDALEYLHSQPYPLIHRDIKPGNLILAGNDRVALVDFGLVKVFNPKQPHTMRFLRGRGTPPYAPPEQYIANLGYTDARSDIYSLGMTLYHLFTAAIPPDASHREMDASLLVPPRRFNPGLSTRTEAAILKAVALQAPNRFQSAHEMREALTKHGEGIPWWLVALVLLFLGLFMAVGVVMAANLLWIPPPAATGTPTAVPATIPSSTSTPAPTESPSAFPTGTPAPTLTPPTPTPRCRRLQASGVIVGDSGTGAPQPWEVVLPASADVEIVLHLDRDELGQAVSFEVARDKASSIVGGPPVNGSRSASFYTGAGGEATVTVYNYEQDTPASYWLEGTGGIGFCP